MTTTDPHTNEHRHTEPPADRSAVVAALLSIFVSPLGYYYVGRTRLAVLNALTLNYLLLGFVVVPVHTHRILKDAKRARKRRTGGSESSQTRAQSATSTFLRQYQSVWVRSD